MLFGAVRGPRRVSFYFILFYLILLFLPVVTKCHSEEGGGLFKNHLLKSSAGTGWVSEILIRMLKNCETLIRIFNLLIGRN